MKTQKYIVEIDMPDGDYTSAGWIQDLIQNDCDNMGDEYGDDRGRCKVRVTEV